MWRHVQQYIYNEDEVFPAFFQARSNKNYQFFYPLRFYMFRKFIVVYEDFLHLPIRNIPFRHRSQINLIVIDA